MKKFTTIVFVCVLTFAGLVQAKAPELIGEYDDWAAYSYKDGKGIVWLPHRKKTKENTANAAIFMLL